MSIEARQALVDSGRLFFQRDSQRADLLDPNVTRTELIALLSYLVDKGHHLELTAVKSDHHDDSDLAPSGVGTHWCGWAADFWPLTGPKPGAYVDAVTQTFRDFLGDLAGAPYRLQTGLGGSANLPENLAAAGDASFSDGDEDHVHGGTHPVAA